MRQRMLWVGLTACLGCLAATGSGDAEPVHTATRRPVLVELFTSEGCSSCPPADALLERLDRTQPVNGAQIIVLSEHVDYWNHLGWQDPYSSRASSARQELYARRFVLEGPYTPQMVVNGMAEFVGSDARKAETAIRAALREPTLGVRLLAAHPGDSAVTLEVDAFPSGKARKANVWVALAADSGTSDVLRGENSGRRLHHVSIATELRQVGTVSDRAGFRSELTLRAGSRLIAFVQEPGNGRVWGAAMLAEGNHETTGR